MIFAEVFMYTETDIDIDPPLGTVSVVLLSVLVFLSVSVTIFCYHILYIIVFQALETAEMYDRVHLRTTYYNYARHLESKGDINGAIPKYAASHL